MAYLLSKRFPFIWSCRKVLDICRSWTASAASAAHSQQKDWIKQHGYPVEDHELKTEDGYLLTYFRIPRGKKKSEVSEPKKPVLLQHGLLGSSADFVLAANSLGYLLADEGYDVWLGNCRGNVYSRKHESLDPNKDKEKFWDYSFHEMGCYDLPAAVDYILGVTNHAHLMYTGFSMGTTMFLVLGATRPDYMAKVEAAVLLGPCAYPWHLPGPVIDIGIKLHLIFHMGCYDLPAAVDYILGVTNHAHLMYTGFSMGTTMFLVLGATRPDYMAKVEAAVLLGPCAYPWHLPGPVIDIGIKLHLIFHTMVATTHTYELFPDLQSSLWFKNNFCDAWPMKKFSICGELGNIIGSFDKGPIRVPLSTIAKFSPTGTSYKTVDHYAQIMATDFPNYDYGPEKNRTVYGSEAPPKYDISRVTAPVYIHFAANDLLSVPQDVEYLAQRMPNVRKVRKVAQPVFNHMDFIWAIEDKELVYNDIIATFNNGKKS